MGVKKKTIIDIGDIICIQKNSLKTLIQINYFIIKPSSYELLEFIYGTTVEW